MIDSFELGHLKVSRGSAALLLDRVVSNIKSRKKIGCIPINVTKYCMSKSDLKLATCIKNSGLVLADGMPIVWLGKRLGSTDVHRITGVAFTESLMSRAAVEGLTLYFFGSTQRNLDAAMKSISSEFTNIKIVGYRNGYYDDDDISSIISDINEVKPDILILGLGLPQKEYFMHDYFPALDVKFCITVGGAIDIWSGSKKRAPKFIQKIGMEWLFRSLYDLSRAYLIVTFGFAFLKDLLFLTKKH